MSTPPPADLHHPQAGIFTHLQFGRPLLQVLLFAALAITPAMAATSAKATAKAKTVTHAFTGTRGEVLDAEVQTVKGVEVIIKRTDGKTFALDIPNLNPADRAYVKQWKATGQSVSAGPATAESDMAVTVTLEQVPTETKTAMAGSFLPRVTLVNRETTVAYQGMKGTLVLVGQSANSLWRFKVLAVEKFTGNIAAGEKFTFTGTACADAAPQGSQPAYRYRGYLLVLQSADDNIIQFLHNGPFAKNAVDSLKLSPGNVFTVRPPLGQIRSRATANANWRPETSVLPLHVSQSPPANSATK